MNQKMTQGIMVYRVPSGVKYTDTALVSGGGGLVPAGGRSLLLVRGMGDK